MKKFFITVVLLSISMVSQAQKKVSYNNLVWLGDFTKAKLNDKWSIYFDFGFRRTEWLNKWSQVLVRPGVSYNLNSNISATVGIAYFRHYSNNYIRPEYRGWQQLLFSDTYGRVKINHRLRAEQRFNQKVVADELMEDYNYNNRFRYQLSSQVALNKKQIENKTAYFSISDEVFINSGREIINNYFDQNRFAIGLGYKLNECFSVQVSYMNVFIQKSNFGVFEENNVLVINIYQDFVFKKKSAIKKI